MKTRGLRQRLKGCAAVVRERLKARILRNVEIHPETGCWLWKGRRNNQGYPVMSVRLPDRDWPVPLFAHRVSLEVFKPRRPPRPGDEAAHAIECPFHWCVCPDHLRWATREQNEADKRHPRRLRIREVYPPTHVLGLGGE